MNTEQNPVNPSGPKSRPLDITMPFVHLEKILDSHVINKDAIHEHIDINNTEILDFKQKNNPKIKVTFSRLESEEDAGDSSDIVSFPINDDDRVDMVINSKQGKPLKYHLNPIKVSYLWDISSFKKVDLLRCGRFKQNDFQPVTKEIPVLEMDLGVSREHSLIGYFNSKMYYIDYGTSIKITQESPPQNEDPKVTHFGSKNGSWVYREFHIADCIKNRCVEWNIHSVIGIGTFFYNVLHSNARQGETAVKLLNQFSFEYETL